jgi:hypothetical protein
MSVWALFAFGVVAFLCLSVLVGLSVSSILGQISREISCLLAEPSGVGLEQTSSRWTLSSPAAWSASSTARPANHV